MFSEWTKDLHGSLCAPCLRDTPTIPPSIRSTTTSSPITSIFFWKPTRSSETKSTEKLHIGGWEIFSSTMFLLALRNVTFAFFDSTVSVSVDDSRLSVAA